MCPVLGVLSKEKCPYILLCMTNRALKNGSSGTKPPHLVKTCSKLLLWAQLILVEKVA